MYNLLTRTELDTADANATEGHRLHKIKLAEIIDIFQQNSHRIICYCISHSLWLQYCSPGIKSAIFWAAQIHLGEILCKIGLQKIAEIARVWLLTKIVNILR